MTDKALKSIIKEAEAMIRRVEGRYAEGVVQDFYEALNQSANEHKTAYEWLQQYRGRKPRRQQNYRKPVPIWTPSANLSKFARMWECTNEICFHFSRPISGDKLNQHLKRKKQALIEIQKLVDADTKEHFRTTLTEVLRSERYAEIRKEAIWMLAKYFDWNEIEFTFELHHKHFGGSDVNILIAASNWCQSHVKDDNALHKAVVAVTKQLIAEAIGA